MKQAANLAGAIRCGRHRLPVRVYYEDTDFSGVVYHASYLRFMERGRTDYLRLLGIDHRGLFEQAGLEAPGYAFVVRSMQIEFLKPARMDDVLEIVTAPEEVKGASIVLSQRVARNGETLVDAKVRFALVAGGKARRIPEALRIAIEADQRAHSRSDPQASAPGSWQRIGGVSP
jgi:acyl-CoA thioester hydrolase